ncbi:CheR family methyltransferase [Pigmentibacter ruber]|uniref:CheR family methyltransferase n=1 Tax=Pigmentibacter ruber TaxID=2683196 RepID=UPI00131E65FF|nr:protein-glutamate O-methyltransferase CheR [Pigmentibacter ruber]
MPKAPQQNNLTFDELISDEAGFNSLSKILLDRTGIFMDPSEKNFSLMSNRLHKVLKKYNCSSYKELISLIEIGSNEVTNEFLEVLTTNTTHFFREKEHFQFLKQNLPKIEENLLKEKRKDIKVWCAASSSGEEPYTILMILNEYFSRSKNISIKIQATDLNTQVLEKAKLGIYKKEISEHISSDLILKYFEESSKIPADSYQVKENYRNMIDFFKFNLKSEVYKFPYKFDLIFCRNVLIYFPQKVVEDTVEKLASCLTKDGYLFIGHSEAMIGNKHKLKSVIPAIYKLNNK